MIVVVLHTFKWFSLGMVLAAVLPKCARDRLNLHRKVLSAGRVERERGCTGKRWEMMGMLVCFQIVFTCESRAVVKVY